MLFGITIIFNAHSSFAQQDTVYKFSLSEAQEFAINNFFVSKNAQLDIDSMLPKDREGESLLYRTGYDGLGKSAASGTSSSYIVRSTGTQGPARVQLTSFVDLIR